MSRHRILRRIREALEGREKVDHPGAFRSWPAGGVAPGPTDPVAAFQVAFEGAGGTVVRVRDEAEAGGRLEELTADLAGMAVGAGVPPGLVPERPLLPPEEAPISISLARGAVAETGSLLLDARDGRRVQLLPPVHVVLVPAGTVHATLGDALAALRSDLPSALGLHSGPSKSADIGQILVEGVHGPGRVTALVVDPGERDPEGERSGSAR